MNALSRKVTGLFLLACITFGGYAQSLDQAKKLYNEGRYEEAKPAFEKLVRQSPNNSSYNLWYGVCCWGMGDWTEAENYLLVARKRKAIEANRYLADIYTQSYRFDEAAEMWEEYIAQLEKKKEDTEAFEKSLAHVEKLQRMKENTEAVQIIDSIVVGKDQLLAAYFLSDDCGRIESYDTHFQSNDPVASTVYVNPKGDQAYYARPTDNGRYALFTHSRLMDTWTDEKPVFRTDSAENNYPFVLGDGRTLYFASKGNGSIGGYDLFVTKYSLNNDAYLTPEQMGMPFNSPANDYLMVIDEAKGVGWFVSDRNQPEGKVCVYLFIPDESRTHIPEGADDELLNHRARLNSIRDTWIDGQDYAGLIRLAQTGSASTGKAVAKDFDFVVNDTHLYNVWSDFRSPEARSFYEKAVGIKKKIDGMKSKLDEARSVYVTANDAMRKQLAPSILKAEDELATLLQQAGEWEKKARNTENVALKNK